MPRLFFAVLLPDAAREAAARLQDELRRLAGNPGVRWEDPAKFHFTLKFLGDTPEERLNAVTEAAREAAAGFGPFRLGLSGPGAFPNPRRPQVLWLGAAGDVPVLARLAESLESALARRGFPKENRPFHPHLTLARVRSPEGTRAAAKSLEKLPQTPPESLDKADIFIVESYVLMRSEMRPSGSVYTVQDSFPLTALAHPHPLSLPA